MRCRVAGKRRDCGSVGRKVGKCGKEGGVCVPKITGGTEGRWGGVGEEDMVKVRKIGEGHGRNIWK